MRKVAGHLRLTPQNDSHNSFKRRHAYNYYIMGRFRAENGAMEEALILLTRALSIDPNFAPALCSTASLHLAQDRLALARSFAERAITLNPDNCDALMILGNIALNEQNPQAALAAFQRAEVGGGNSPELSFNTGLAHLFLGNAGAAAEMFEQILETNPLFHRAWDALGCARKLLKDNQGAISAFLRALQIDPNLHDSRDHLAQVLLEMGDLQHAQQILESVLTADPGRHTSRHLLGMTFAALADFENAATCWEKIIEQEAASAETYHLLANAYMHQHKNKQARTVLQTLVTQYPNHLSAHVQLALLLLENGEQEAGRRHIDIAAQLDPQHPAVIQALAVADTLASQLLPKNR